MEKFISKYGLAAHLAIVAVAPLFLSPTAVIYLSALALVWLIMEPSRIGYESLHESRRRVFKAVMRDPVFWFSLVLLAMAVFRYYNTGIARSYDAENAKWFLSTAAFPLMPGAVEGCGFAEMALCAVLVPLLPACQHALGRSARQMFAVFASFFAGAGALTWATLIHLESPAALELLKQSALNSDYYGTAFGVYFVLSTAALFSVMERGWLRSLPLAMIGVGGTALALFLFAPAYVQVLFVSAAFIVFLYSFVVARLSISGTAEFKYLVLFSLSLVGAYLVVFAVLGNDDINARVLPYMTGEFLDERFFEVRELLDQISLRIWREHPWLGCGLGSYKTALAFHTTAEEWLTVSPMQVSPMNGYWLLLVERGAVGAFLFAVMLALLLWAYFARLVKGVRAHLPSPLAFVGFFALIAAALQGVVDISFLNPGLLAALTATVALSASSFPKEKK